MRLKILEKSKGLDGAQSTFANFRRFFCQPDQRKHGVRGIQSALRQFAEICLESAAFIGGRRNLAVAKDIGQAQWHLPESALELLPGATCRRGSCGAAGAGRDVAD